METKPLLFGIIGFMLGGFVVSLAATTIYAPATSMDSATRSLASKTSDKFDEEYINSMIAHHQSAIDMARLAESRAKHPEIKTLSQSIIDTQDNEIDLMKSWQKKWDYQPVNINHSQH